ncbi:uncharacterized protein [Nicotiana sylvestris]|uniref:uncharacterized protein n=1 Tax=Nicotiana sylvestris TaxID=4096 RepID=UPI00388CE00F
MNLDSACGGICMVRPYGEMQLLLNNFTANDHNWKGDAESRRALKQKVAGALPNDTDKNPQVNAVTLRNGRELEEVLKKRNDKPIPEGELIPMETHESKKYDASSELVNAARPPPPFPQRLQKNNDDRMFNKFLSMLSHVQLNIPLVHVLHEVPKYAKYIIDIVAHKRRLTKFETVTRTEECTSKVKNKLPQKLKDPGNFTIPVRIGNIDVSHTLCDLGESINLMPLSLFNQLDLGAPRPTTEEKMLRVLREHKQAIRWMMSDIRNLSPTLYMHKILMEEGYKPCVEQQHYLNPIMKEVVRKEVIKWLDAGIVFQISDSKWIAIAPEDQGKTTLMCPYGTYDFKRMPGLYNAPATFQRCEETNFVLNWENAILWFLEKDIPFRFDDASLKAFEDLKGRLVEAIALPTNDAKVVVNIVKKHILRRYGIPRVLISDGGTHFCSKLLKNVLAKYGIKHKVATSYQPQTNGQVEMSNEEVKHILEWDWARKLDDGLWAYRTAYKTPIGTYLYKLVYEKACHLPVEHKNKAYWAIKKLNIDMDLVGEKWLLQLSELDEFRLYAYKNTKLYKEKTKRWHDNHIHHRKFEPSQEVLLFNSRLKLFPGKLKSQ